MTDLWPCFVMGLAGGVLVSVVGGMLLRWLERRK